MANSILKLKVESSEYDQKLANAAKGIRHLADVAHKGAGELTGLEKSEVDYIKALGDMETKSRTASGQVRELSSTYKELKVIYDQLNEVEKADEGGKALAASLETLKQRAQEAKAQLDTATQSLQSNGEAGKGTSGILEVLKDKFTINIDALTLFNKGLQVAEVALNVAKDAFFASEATVDEWGRIVDSSKSLYEGFLTALNTGDISGYLGRIDEIVQAARTAYNELDRLGTMKTIQGPKMSAQQTENERMRMMIQTGRYIAPVDGRRASMKDGQLLTPEQIRGLETKLQNGMKTVVSLVGNEVKQTGKAIDAVYNRQAKELGLSLKEFRKGTSSMAEFDKRIAGYEQYQKWREQHTTIDIKSGRETVARGNPFEQFAKWGTFRVDGQRYNDLVRLIQQRDQQASQAYSMQSQAYRTMNRAEGVTVSKLMRGETTGGATGGRGGGSRGGFDLSKIAFDPNKAALSAMKGVETGPSEIWKAITEGAKESTSSVEDLAKAFEELNAVQGVTSGEGVKDSSEMAKSWSNAGTAISAVGSAMSQIEDPAAKVMATVAQAIATIALTYAKSLEGTFTPWDWIAGAASGLAMMINVISAIHSSTGYAQGGVIKGNSYSGDNIGGMVDGGAGGFVGLNAGEVVLNAAQQNTLAQNLSGNLRSIHVVGKISGTDIILSADRTLMTQGKQLAVWGR
jgi:hypothetical protein